MKRILIFLFSTIFILSASVAVAQDHRVEFKPFFGYTTSSGVDISELEIPGSAIVDKISPKSSFSWGLQFDYNATEHFSVGFIFDQQMSKLRAHTRLPVATPTSSIPGVPGDVDFADLDTFNYHGVFTYNFGEEKSSIRPFLFGGLGATQYSPGDVEVVVPTPGSSSSVNSFTRFSTTWGGGIKAYAGPHIGFQFMTRWTPTYIKDDPIGYWCSPFWGCYVVGNSQFSDQLEFSGGLIFRF